MQTDSNGKMLMGVTELVIREAPKDEPTSLPLSMTA
jgi:hypothetical protein